MNFEIVISGPGFNDTGHALRPEMRRTIGTDPTADIQLAAPKGAVVAGRHIVLWNDGTACRLATDGGAVTLNGRPFAKGREARLADGDVIELGPWRLRISVLEILGTDEFEEILTKPFGTTRDKAVMTPPPKSVAPKVPPRPKPDATQVRPKPTAPTIFELPAHLRREASEPATKENPGEPNRATKLQKNTLDTKPPVSDADLPFRDAVPPTPPGPSPKSNTAPASSPIAKPSPKGGGGLSRDPVPKPNAMRRLGEIHRPPRVVIDYEVDTFGGSPAPAARNDPASPPAPPISSVEQAISEKGFAGGIVGSGVARGGAVAPKGHALFRVPRIMWTEIAELAELRLAHGDPMTVAMRAELERTMVGRGHRTDEHPVARMGNRMQARLFGDDRYFSIAPLGSEAQDISPGESAEWDWRITPLREGHSLLTLRLTMLADIEGNKVTVDAEALHTSVEITVKSFFTRPRRFVRDNWRWMLGSSGIGAAAALYALLRGT